MKDGKYILALDQGTTSSRAILFDLSGRPVNTAQKEFQQFYPEAGWVEHDAEEIWNTQKQVLLEVTEKEGVNPADITAVGITNQRETVVLWDRETGKPVYHAVVWQCRRTAGICSRIRADKELSGYIRRNTGLLADPYFSATKIRWILDHVPQAEEKRRKGTLLCGTIDSWLLWKLTGGKVFATDISNASRTMLFNIHKHCWDEELCRYFSIDPAMLPEVRPSSGLFGYTSADLFDGISIPVTGAAGDQQAALFGQKCFSGGDVKNTYGTGCFLMMNTGETPVPAEEGLLTTIAWEIGGKVTYALEGSIFIGGAVVQWLRDELGLIGKASDSEFFAAQEKDNGGVYFVPAFVGLGTPYWDTTARGTIIGLTRGSNKNHIIRAALEAVAYQSRDVISCFQTSAGLEVPKLRVDGGGSSNNFMMQFQADILGIPVIRPENIETTAAGAAMLAGLAAGCWGSLEELRESASGETEFSPRLQPEHAEFFYKKWRKAIRHARGWEE